MYYSTTFLNGDEKLKEKGLETLKSVRNDLNFFLNFCTMTLREVLEKLKEFGTDIDISEYYDLNDPDDEETYEMDLESLLDDLINSSLYDNLVEIIENEFSNYGLCFDYVEDGSEYNPDEPYFRYQIAWGGPSYEIRFYENGFIEFAYLDWYVGVGFDVSNDSVFSDLYEYFRELGLLNFEKEI